MVALRVLLTVEDTQPVVASAMTLMSAHPAPMDPTAVPDAPAGFVMDRSFPAIPIHEAAIQQISTMSAQPNQIGHGSHLIRGTIDHGDLDNLTRSATTPQGQPRLFSDPEIGLTPNPTCHGDPPLGTSLDVQRLLGAGRLSGLGMEGDGCAVAVVDTGINLPYLRERGLCPRMDFHASWSPVPSIQPGAAPVDHGTMCAYDVMLAAPRALFLDYALLQSTREGGSRIDGFLSDALQGFSRLLQLMLLSDDEPQFRSMVVSNSWAMFSRSWDFPPDNPGRYADNPDHPFNVIVRSLSGAGADIVFAAGNCGPACPNDRCDPPGPSNMPTVTGANSHPDVTCVAGVDTNRKWVGYSSLGPGALPLPAGRVNEKPDIAAYTHFLGSEALGKGKPDSGTSAACPVMAGVIAAVRSVYPFDRTNPKRTSQNLKQYFLQNTRHPGRQTGWRNDLGYGIVDTAALVNAQGSLA